MKDLFSEGYETDIRNKSLEYMTRVIETGEFLKQARLSLGLKEWRAMVKDELRWTERTATMLVAISEDVRLRNWSEVPEGLHFSWEKLYALTTLSDAAFEAAVTTCADSTA